jgi:sirohydrochlorin ferrochelatase
MSRSALLLLAHGSRDPRHAAVVRALAARVGTLRPGLRRRVAFLDHCGPSAAEAVDALAAEGVRRVTVVPLLLSRAFHARFDVPAALAGAAARHRELTIRQAEVLGWSPLLLPALERRLAQAGAGGRERDGTGVVLAAAGSSDPGALAAVGALAREWERTGGWFAVRPAYASAAAPDTGAAVRALRAAGARRVVVAPCMLAPGRLSDRVAEQAARAGAALTAGVLGDAEEIARLVLLRHDPAGTATPAPLPV